MLTDWSIFFAASAEDIEQEVVWSRQRDGSLSQPGAATAPGTSAFARAQAQRFQACGALTAPELLRLGQYVDLFFKGKLPEGSEGSD
eukprot:7098848-Alexandrium_andersonii.AAC.1